MRRTILFVLGLATLLYATAPQVADTVAFKNTRTAYNTALASLFTTLGKVPVGAYEVGAEDGSALTTTNLTNHAIVVNNDVAKTLAEASCISDAGSQAVTVKIGATTLFSITCVAPGSYSTATTNGTTGYIVAASMGSTAIGAHVQLDLSGTANTTTKDIKLHIYGTVN